MHTDLCGRLVDTPAVRVGFIGCGNHSYRNIFPTFQFAPIQLVATCDLDEAKATAYHQRFGAEYACSDHRRMLDDPSIDAVFIVTGYDDDGRPLYPKLAADCLAAGKHVWFEKPPAASCSELESLQRAAEKSGRHAMCGLKKMFFPANEKAYELAARPDFGGIELAALQYPQWIPPAEALRSYLRKPTRDDGVISFLDHLCHPTSLMVYLLGMPRTLYYERSDDGAGAALFTFDSGAVAALNLTHGQSHEGGMERTLLVGRGGHHIVVDNNKRVTYHRGPVVPAGQGYGRTPSFFTGSPDETTAVWEPEFSLGQLYNKGLFLLGYWGEVNAFARGILDGQPPTRGTLQQAWECTRIFEAFAEGPGVRVDLAR
jgi:predicted dehydrogenase